MNIELAVAAAITGLQLGEHFTFEALTDAVQRQRQHKIKVAELSRISGTTGLCALLLMGEKMDLILHARTDSALHSQQFVLHEFAHIILGHDLDAGCIWDEEVLDTLLPDIPGSLRSRMLARSGADTEHEAAAESLADRLATGIRGSVFAETRYAEIFG